ncbi:MAG: hypothetical protein AAF490_10750 [Chloroflexota bacterium]
MSYQIAIVAYGKFAQSGNYWPDDNWLRLELARRGHNVSIVDWEIPFDPIIFDAIFISTTWNFHYDPNRFLNWLDSCEIDGKSRLINDKRLLKHAVRKYDIMLPLLERFGEKPSVTGSIVPTRFFIPAHISNELYNSRFANAFNLNQLEHEYLTNQIEKIERQNSEDESLWLEADLVLKPACSADGRMTYLYSRIDAEYLVASQHENILLTKASIANGTFLEILSDTDNQGGIIQIYQRAVQSGEYSLTFFNDELSHAVKKPGGFRQDVSLDRIFVGERDLPDGMLDFANRILLFVCEKYGLQAIPRVRVDMFTDENGPILSEIEFLEPNTNLRNVPEKLRNELIQRYADAILKQIILLKG